MRKWQDPKMGGGRKKNRDIRTKRSREIWRNKGRTDSLRHGVPDGEAQRRKGRKKERGIVSGLKDTNNFTKYRISSGRKKN